MNTILKLEDLGKFVFAYFFTLYLGFSWWMFFAFLLVPDLSMIGYLINNKVGAWIYNIAHHQGIAVLVILMGYLVQQQVITFSGWVLFGHSAMDRAFGYGLKYSDDFKHTHLGWI